jgi:hypothetical protein
MSNHDSALTLTAFRALAQAGPGAWSRLDTATQQGLFDQAVARLDAATARLDQARNLAAQLVALTAAA